MSSRIWSEIFTVPFARILIARIPALPGYVKALTIGGTILTIIGALSFHFTLLIFVPIILFISRILDDADGMLSRKVYGKDPEWRGTLDFVSDHFGGAILLLSTFFYLNDIGKLSLFVYLVIGSSCACLQTTKFRLYAVLGNIQKVEKDCIALVPTTLGSFWSSWSKPFNNRKLIAYPSEGDASFLIWIIGPFIGFHPIVFIIAIICIMCQTVIEYLIPTFVLVKKSEVK